MTISSDVENVTGLPGADSKSKLAPLLNEVDFFPETDNPCFFVTKTIQFL